jgi:hypothetical protein
MLSVELELRELATVVQPKPFHFHRYRSKSVPEGPTSQAEWLPELLL